MVDSGRIASGSSENVNKLTMKLKDSEKPLIQPRVWKTTEIIPKFLSHGCMLGGTKIWIVKKPVETI